MINITKELQRQMETHYGIFLTDTQVSAILATRPDIETEIVRGGEVETCLRSSFAAAIGDYLNLKGNWPSGRDDDLYACAYFLAFAAAAKKANIKLSPTFVTDKLLAWC